MVLGRRQGRKKHDFGAKLVPKGCKLNENGSQSGPKSRKLSQNGAQRRPKCTKKGAKTTKGPPKRSPAEKYRFSMPKRCDRLMLFGPFWEPFLVKNLLKTRSKNLSKNNTEKVQKMMRKRSKNGAGNWWFFQKISQCCFFEKCCFSLGKPHILKVEGSQISSKFGSEIYQKTCSKKWWNKLEQLTKINQKREPKSPKIIKKWGPKIDAKIDAKKVPNHAQSGTYPSPQNTYKSTRSLREVHTEREQIQKKMYPTCT